MNSFLSDGGITPVGGCDFRIERKKTMSKSRGDEWYTPRALVEALRPFDTDPSAPSKDHWTARLCYTKEDDGLKQPWYGRVWGNFPYSDIEPWIDKAIEHGNCVLLTYARTDTKWMQKALDACDALHCLKGRIAFVDANEKKGSTSTAPSVLIAFGENNVDALEEAAAKGLIQGKLFIQASKARKLIVPEERKLITGADLGFNKLAAD